ncbi:MAG: transglycosylase SLT domain-containing protein [Pseudomonadota bacterium]
MQVRFVGAAALVLGAALVSGCSELSKSMSGAEAQVTKGNQNIAVEDLPPMRWDHSPRAQQWTEASLAALDSHGAILPTLTPRDVERYCPAYPEAGAEDRKAFWAGMLSSLAKHESTWREAAVGGGGKWFGLVQIAPATARGYGCEARSGEALKNGELNLSCAVRIMSVTVPRDGVVASSGDGLAADWGPFHSSRKHEDIAAWTRVQPYCQAQS